VIWHHWPPREGEPSPQITHFYAVVCRGNWYQAWLADNQRWIGAPEGVTHWAEVTLPEEK